MPLFYLCRPKHADANSQAIGTAPPAASARLARELGPQPVKLLLKGAHQRGGVCHGEVLAVARRSAPRPVERAVDQHAIVKDGKLDCKASEGGGVVGAVTKRARFGEKTASGTTAQHAPCGACARGCRP